MRTLNENEFIYLIKIDPAANNNKFYRIERINDELIATYGRVNENTQTKTYPLERLEKLYNSKIKKGYVDHTELFIEESQDKVNIAPTVLHSNNKVNTFLTMLYNNTTEYAQSALSVNINKVTSKQVSASKDQLQLIAQTLSLSLEDANAELIKQFQIIPRYIDRRVGVAAKLFNGDKEHDDNVLNDEYELLEQLETLVEDVIVTDNKQISLPFDIEIVNNSEIRDLFYNGIKHQYTDTKLLNIFAVNHKITHKNYVDYGNTKLLWHGSRTQNWSNILDKGLKVRPPGIPTTGSMFGNGIYFAELSQKSIGYTSLSGSYWASGNTNRGILALYNVGIGSVLIDEYGGYSASIENAVNKGYNSLWCYGRDKNSGSNLWNDEIIIPNGNQCTIKYILEIGK